MDFCPNNDCSNSSGTPKDWYVKIGYEKYQWYTDERPVKFQGMLIWLYVAWINKYKVK